ncbi:hypothetical protein DOY81_003209 [Sarcophaga bullata]|nr:hypothetical protein DOY81_003209 [Sarcophaga bullata]
MGSRKDDPVFNVKFVQLVESKPCLWNSTLPEYSKKDEIQKAWQEVANETKDTVRNCRERWRTIRSSFLRSLKLSRTSTGRGKRKYYLSKYLQFLIPFTRSRPKNSSTIIAERKVTATTDSMPPMTRISNMPIVSSDETKDSSNSAEVAAIAEGDVMVTLHEGAVIGSFPMAQHAALPLPLPLPLPLNLQTIKQEKDVANSNLTEFAEWLKSKNEQKHHCLMTSSPDADQSFLNSLHPYLREMTGKQNRRFKQKAIALIDDILDNTD